MADYFTKFSVILRLPDEAAQIYALEISNQAARISQGDEAPDNFPTSLLDEMDYWGFETDANTPAGEWGVWLHSDYGGIDAVCAFIQHLLQKFELKERVEIEWSNDCSKPRTDAYGGGAAIVTAATIISMSTDEWLAQHGAGLGALQQ